jgi:hypothetical protein
MKKICFIHTVESVGQFLKKHAARTPHFKKTRTSHIVRPDLLELAEKDPAAAEKEFEKTVKYLLRSNDALIVSCSSLGLFTSRLFSDQPVFQIDDCLGNAAVQYGSKIALLVTNSTTIRPSRLKLFQAAAENEKSVTVDMICCRKLISFLGEASKHKIEEIFGRLNLLFKHYDCIVLAQVSTAMILEEYLHKLPPYLLEGYSLTLPYIYKRVTNSD